MFGYIRVYENELKVREYRLYKSVYCGLCKTMKKQLGYASSLNLSYDFVFLALLRSYVLGEGFKIKPGRCFLHPFRKRPIAEGNSSLDYSAGASAILIYNKLLDDLQDNGFLRRGIVRLSLPFYRSYIKRAKRKQPGFGFEVLSEKVKKYLDKLTRLEKEDSKSAEQNAEIFGELLGEIFSHGLDSSETAEQCRLLGFHLGRWIYLIDLMDDFDKDKRQGAYNPLISAGYTSIPTDLLTASLYRENELAENCLAGLPVTYEDIGAILKNILELGLSNTCAKIQKTQKQTTDKAERNSQSDGTGSV